jgi:hypothetical protein
LRLALKHAVGQLALTPADVLIRSTFRPAGGVHLIWVIVTGIGVEFRMSSCQTLFPKCWSVIIAIAATCSSLAAVAVGAWVGRAKVAPMARMSVGVFILSLLRVSDRPVRSLT